MPVYEEEPVVRKRVIEEPVVERRVIEEPPVQRVVRQAPRSDDLTGYALIKYGFILLMTLVILYFIANYFIPLLR